jgi:hypothetical protein
MTLSQGIYKLSALLHREHLKANNLEDFCIFINKHKTTIQLYIHAGLIRQETSIQKLKRDTT